jgi:nucleotide-binding universal stress UspA family protein
MSEETPRHVICAVRGGPQSRETVSRAIGLALQHRARLTLLHILDAEFLEHATIGPLSVIYNELVEMGKFAMIILRDRAQRRGVEEVDYIVREGSVRTHLTQFAIETQAEVMVMGCPRRSPGRNVYTAEEFEAFVAEVEARGGIKIVQVMPEIPSPGEGS